MEMLPEFLITSMSRVIAGLLIVLAMDCITEAALILYNNKFRLSTYLPDIIKKVFYLFIVLLAFIFDYIILSFDSKAGPGENITGTLGMAVTLFVIGHGGLTVLDNLIGIGLPVPDILLKAFNYIKDQSGRIRKVNAADEPDEESNNRIK